MNQIAQFIGILRWMHPRTYTHTQRTHMYTRHAHAYTCHAHVMLTSRLHTPTLGVVYRKIAMKTHSCVTPFSTQKIKSIVKNRSKQAHNSLNINNIRIEYYLESFLLTKKTCILKAYTLISYRRFTTTTDVLSHITTHHNTFSPSWSGNTT
jgi:hypothetical protein